MIRYLIFAVLYSLAFLGANHAAAQLTTPEMLRDAREGDMLKLVVHNIRQPVPDTEYFDAAANSATLQDHLGKPVILNFWATWCPPCREEMPTLEALQAKFGEDQLLVLALATGRNSRIAVVKFFSEIDVQSLKVGFDPDMSVARKMLVVGLPTTVIIDSEGFEVARMVGEADWSSDSAFDIVRMLHGEGS